MLSATLERKAFYSTTGTLSVTTSGVVGLLSSITQGNTNATRVGDELSSKALNISYSIAVGAPGLVAVADEYNTVRVIIFKWIEDNGLAAPTPAIVLDGSPNTWTLSQYNFDNMHDFKILYDKSHVVYNTPIWNGAAVTWQHGVGAIYATPTPIHIKLSGKILFDADTVYGKNHVYYLVVSDSAFTPNPTIELSGRFLFEDG